MQSPPVLHIDPEREPDRAKRTWESHLARAKWVTENGYRHLLRLAGRLPVARHDGGEIRKLQFPAKSPLQAIETEHAVMPPSPVAAQTSSRTM
jgi:hypothetical protein